MHLTQALTGSQIKEDLQSVLSSQSSIFIPTDQDWTNETTQRYNTWNSPSYIASVKPALKEDVQKLVRLSPLYAPSILSNEP